MKPSETVEKAKVARDTPSSRRPMVSYSCAQYGNEIVLTYKHHKNPTALDLRRMGEMLMREAQNCLGAAIMLENIEEAAKREKDAYLP